MLQDPCSRGLSMSVSTTPRGRVVVTRAACCRLCGGRICDVAASTVCPVGPLAWKTSSSVTVHPTHQVTPT